jgi:hypothetical protein
MAMEMRSLPVRIACAYEQLGGRGIHHNLDAIRERFRLIGIGTHRTDVGVNHDFRLGMRANNDVSKPVLYRYPFASPHWNSFVESALILLARERAER